MNNTKIKVGFVALGCPKALCDVEQMTSRVKNANFTLVPEPGLADVVVINTCGFIQSAKEEAIEEILEAVSRKNDGINKHILVTGCLAARYKNQLVEEFPEIDGAVSLVKNKDIVRIILEISNGNKVFEFAEKDEVILELNDDNENIPLISATLPSYSYLRIADGCSNKCAYCAIPLIRGEFVSRKFENIIDEAKNLIDNGIKEIVLVAQDTTRYGLDIYGELQLAKLLKSIADIEGDFWIRIMYCYPERITDELIDVIANTPKVVKYLDVPIQHSETRVLKKMNRVGTSEKLAELFEKMYKKIPGLVLRTTVIVGFPSETEEEFTHLAEFLHEENFFHLGCFEYSPEEDTPIVKDPDFEADEIDENEKATRRQIIEEQQEFRTNDNYTALINKTFKVLVEGFDKWAEVYFGRSFHLAPEVDGMIYISKTDGKDVKLYEFSDVVITEIKDNLIFGEIV